MRAAPERRVGDRPDEYVQTVDAWMIACLAWGVWVTIFLWVWRRAFHVLDLGTSDPGRARDSAPDPYLN